MLLAPHHLLLLLQERLLLFERLMLLLSGHHQHEEAVDEYMRLSVLLMQRLACDILVAISRTTVSVIQQTPMLADEFKAISSGFR